MRAIFTNIELLGIFALVSLLLLLSGCHTIAPSMTPTRPIPPALPYPSLTISINQHTPNYTGGDRPCSNARVLERVVCGDGAPDTPHKQGRTTYP
jgi:hypothetical protein